MFHWSRNTGLIAVVVAVTTTCCFAAELVQLPKNWIAAGSAPQNYAMGIDDASSYQGQTSIAVSSRPDAQAGGFGTAMQTIDSANYRSQRVRFRAFVRSANVLQWAGLWMRVDGSQGKTLAFDNMSDRPIKGTTEWRAYDVVLDVPPNSIDIAFGILLAGSGEVWLTKPSLEKVGRQTATTSLPKEPVLQW